MSIRYFRVPENSDGTAPKYDDQVDGFSGTTVGNSPRWIVRFRADDAILDDIAAKSDTTELTHTEWADTLNSASVSHLEGAGRPHSADEWDRRFQI